MTVEEVLAEIADKTCVLVRTNPKMAQAIYAKSCEDFCDFWTLVLEARAHMESRLLGTRKEDLDLLIRSR